MVFNYVYILFIAVQVMRKNPINQCGLALAVLPDPRYL